MRRAMSIALVITMVLAAGGFATLFVWPPINHVITGQTAQYPDIQPKAYRVSQTRATYAVVESIEALDRFEVVNANIDGADVTATVTTKFGRFTDDLHVWIEANGEGGAVVFMESQSRVGRSDFGQNARTIRRLFAAIDERIGE